MGAKIRKRWNAAGPRVRDSPLVPRENQRVIGVIGGRVCLPQKLWKTDPSPSLPYRLARVQAYISGALLNAAAIDRSRALYERFADACRAAGWEAYVPHQHADPVRDAHLSNMEVAERDVDQVTAAEVIVAYVGEPSLGVGAEVAIALRGGKRVLLVAEADRRVSRFLLGLAELHPSQARVLRYQTEDEAVTWITDQLRALGSDTGV